MNGKQTQVSQTYKNIYKTIMADNENFENRKINLLNDYHSQLKQLEEVKEQLVEAKKNNDQRKLDFYNKRITSILNNINNLKMNLTYMRPNIEEDLIERQEIMSHFSKLVNEAIPDDVPIVFHGNDNIGIVKQIISSGGLYTPLEREIDFKSFATQIDVTYKSNIRVSLEKADSGFHSFMPYGAIFVFYPKKNEYKNVLKTRESSEVFNGVESVRFDEDRFIGMITTNENLEELKKLCSTNNLNPDKVFNHEQFIKFCKSKFIAETRKTR